MLTILTLSDDSYVKPHKSSKIEHFRRGREMSLSFNCLNPAG